MKKIISLGAVIVVLAIVITAFTACGDKTEEDTTTTTVIETNVELGGKTVEIGEDSAVIKEDGFVVQTLNYPKDSDVVFDLEYAKEHNEFIDFNFDGIDDFYIAVSTENGVINYYCWIYNETTKLYEYSKELSALKNISVDAEKHLVISTVPQADGDNITCYKWVEGVLTLDVAYDSSTDEVPEEITDVVVNNKPLGTDKQPSADVKETTTKKQSSADTKETTTKKQSSADTKETTTKKQSSADTKETTIKNQPSADIKETTTKKPLNTTTTQPSVQQGVVVNTDSNIDDGWF